MLSGLCNSCFNAYPYANYDYSTYSSNYFNGGYVPITGYDYNSMNSSIFGYSQAYPYSDAYRSYIDGGYYSNPSMGGYQYTAPQPINYGSYPYGYSDPMYMLGQDLGGYVPNYAIMPQPYSWYNYYYQNNLYNPGDIYVDQDGNPVEYVYNTDSIPSQAGSEQVVVANPENPENPEATNSNDPGSFWGAVATGTGVAVVGIPGIQKGLARQVYEARSLGAVKEIFWGAEGAGMTAAGQKLWRENPHLMLKFEANMNTLYLQFSKIAAKNPNNNAVSTYLNKFNKMAKTAIETGDPEIIAKVNARAETAISSGKGGNIIGRLFKRGHIDNAAIKYNAAQNAVVDGVTAQGERSLGRALLSKSMLRGAGGMAVLSAGIDVIEKKSRGEEINWTETGTRAVLSSAAFCVGEKVASRAVGKLAGKLAGKCAGRAIGAAIGSIWPGVGTAIGFVVGCIADWAINKWVMPKLFPTENKNSNQSQNQAQAQVQAQESTVEVRQRLLNNLKK